MSLSDSFLDTSKQRPPCCCASCCSTLFPSCEPPPAPPGNRPPPPPIGGPPQPPRRPPHRPPLPMVMPRCPYADSSAKRMEYTMVSCSMHCCIARSSVTRLLVSTPSVSRTSALRPFVWFSTSSAET